MVIHLGLLAGTFFVSIIVFSIFRATLFFIKDIKIKSFIAGLCTFAFGAFGVYNFSQNSPQPLPSSFLQQQMFLYLSYALWGLLFPLYNIWRSKK